MKTQGCILFASGVKGTEAEAGALAQKLGIEEVHFTFQGHTIVRKRGTRVLTQEELQQGDVSLAYVSKLLNRTYSNAQLFRKILQTIWHIINAAEEVFVVGKILEDDTVKGGTGWGAEFAKICNKTLYVFDQEEKAWSKWKGQKWKKEIPKIKQKHFAVTGTRFLNKEGKYAIRDLFGRSFK